MPPLVTRTTGREEEWWNEINARVRAVWDLRDLGGGSVVK